MTLFCYKFSIISYHRLLSHFLPDLVLSHIKNEPATIMPAVNIAANISILLLF